MKYFKIDNSDDQRLFLKVIATEVIMSKEPVFLQLDDSFGLDELNKFLGQIKTRSSKEALVFDLNWWLNNTSYVRNSSITRGVIRTKLVAPPTRNSPYLTRDIPFERRSPELLKLIDSIRFLKREVPTLELSVEFQITMDNIGLIFSSVMALKEFDVKRIYLDPQELSLSCHHLFREQFDNLKIYFGKEYPRVTFSIHHPMRQEWNAATLNEFNGPTIIEIDLNNACNHSCLFCGLHNQNFRDDLTSSELENAKIDLKSFMQQKIPAEIAKELIESLPDDNLAIRFGGAGEPLLHPCAIELLRLVRERGFSLRVYTNLSNLTDDDILEIHNLSGESEEISFIVNLSGYTPETYISTRPKQTEKEFRKIMTTLEKFAELKDRDIRGVHLTIMSVVNRFNYHELADLVRLSSKLNAVFYPKPMEIHGRKTLELRIPTEEHQQFLKYFHQMLQTADLLATTLDLTLPFKKYAEDYAVNKAKQSDKAPESIDKNSEEVRAQKKRRLERLAYKRLHLEMLQRSKYKIDQKIVPLEQGDALLTEFYDSTACYVGFIYIRVKVDLEAMPCCTSTYQVAGKIGEIPWWEWWSSQQVSAFREKMLKLPTLKHHRRDEEWAFCQQCSFHPSNTTYQNQREGVRPFKNMKTLLLLMLFTLVSCQKSFKLQEQITLNLNKSNGIPTDLFLEKRVDGKFRFLITSLDYQKDGFKPTRPVLVEMSYDKSAKFNEIEIVGAAQVVHPRHVSIGDLNNDLQSDYLIADHGYDALPFPGAIPTLLQSTQNGLTTTGSLLKSVPKGFYFYSEIADFNGDGNKDIFLSNLKQARGEVDSNIYFYQSGKYEVKYPSPFQSNHLAALAFDRDNDGDQDLFLGGAEEFIENKNSPYDEIWENLGNGKFQKVNLLPSRLEPLWGTASAISTDMNLDGKEDIVTSLYNNGFSQGSVQIYLNGIPNFKSVALPFRPSSLTYPFFIPWVSVANYSGTHEPDILFTIRDSSNDMKPKLGRQYRYYEQKNGEFIDRTNDIPLVNTHFVAAWIVDIDGDMQNELLFVDYDLKFYIIER